MLKPNKNLNFDLILPPFALETRTKHKTIKDALYSTRAFQLVYASEHANFFRTFILRAYGHKHIIGFGTIFLFKPRNEGIHRAIMWHNTYLDTSAHITLANILLPAMDQ